MRIYTPKEAAELLSVEEGTILSWVRAGMLDASRLSRTKCVRITDDGIKAFLDKTKIEKGE